MASDKKFVDFVIDQIENTGDITAKSMFGEYGIYSGNKIFALICDNKLFIKPTESGRLFIKDVVEAVSYTHLDFKKLVKYFLLLLVNFNKYILE